MLKRVEEYIRKNKMIEPGDLVVVGVSGGADSVCLLDILCKLAPKMQFDICAVHVNHMIRGNEAERDEAYVEELCRQYGVRLICRHVDVPTLARQSGESTEEAGRKARYAAFAEVAGGTKIAVAHHADDQAETVLHNIVRGSSLRGAGGMRPVRENVIRPLLCVRRAEIEAYLAEKNIEFCTDSTNLGIEYTRNKIRSQVMPFLTEQVNSDVVGNINELAGDLSECYEFIKCRAEEVFCRTVSQNVAGETVISVAAVEMEPAILRREVILMAIKQSVGTVKDITRRHINFVDELIFKEVSKQVVLPYDVVAVRDYDEIRICKGQPVLYEKKALEIVMEVEDFDGDWEKLTNDYTKVFDYDKIKGGLNLRTRMTGDYIVLDESGSRKSLKKFFIDAKIPSRMRDNIWLVAEGSHVLWIIGYRVSAAYKTDGSTKRVLKITLRRNSDDGI